MDRLLPLRADGRFINPAFARQKRFENANEPGFRDFLRWRRERKRNPRPKTFHVDRIDPAPERLPAPPARAIRATWVGHSSVVLQMDGKTFLTDPVWSTRIGTVVKRLTPPGIPWSALPHVDGVLLSHNHYDHMDAPTLKRLPRETPIACPTGVAAWLRGRGFRRVTELGWWDATEWNGAKLTCVPAQHFSGRTPWDRDRALWGGYVLEGAAGSRVYFAGDTGYHPELFRQIGDAFPALDLAMIPIGAYAPRWFMSPVHVDPAEAGQAFLDCGARAMLPIHWGTFRLADEHIDEPPRELETWWRANGIEPERWLKLPLGGSVDVGPISASSASSASMLEAEGAESAEAGKTF